MLVHHRITPNNKFTATHLYTWVERGTVRVKCLTQEHNIMSLARVWTQTVHSGVERTNHEATVPPTMNWLVLKINSYNKFFEAQVTINGITHVIHVFETKKKWSFLTLIYSPTTIYWTVFNWVWLPNSIQQSIGLSWIEFDLFDWVWFNLVQCSISFDCRT